MAIKISRLTIALVLGLGAASGAVAQGVTCSNAEFSDAVVQKYPNIRKACLEIVDRGADQVAMVKVRLLRHDPGDKWLVKVKQPDGTYSKPISIAIPEPIRVVVQGKQVSPDELSVDQELTAFFKVKEPQVAAAPAEPTMAPVYTAVAFDTQSETMAANMPRTGSNLPAVFGLGLGFLGLAGTLRFSRRWQLR